MVRGGLRGDVRARVFVRAARRPRGWVAAILAGSLLAACGQRGPLYLPSPPPEPAPRVRTPPSGTVATPPAPAPAQAAPGAGSPTDTSARPARRPD
jgi:predicted small lipoprotein YifL